MKIAVTHPGKIGDLLYCLPAVRHISKILDSKVDFWTQKECLPVKSLLESQSYINEVHINETYVKQHEGCGVQPWLLEPIGDYDRIYHMGLRSYPQGRLVDYYPSLHGFTFCDTSIQYDFTKREIPSGIVVSPGRNPILKPLFSKLITELAQNHTIYQVGPPSETINITHPNLKTISEDMLGTIAYINACHTFIGTLSANLVLANGFSCNKIIICEKERHNPAHDVHNESHIYLDFPVSPEEVIKCVKL